MKHIEDVRTFWEDNPLFTGESQEAVGSKEWFDEFESTILSDNLPRGFEPIYTQGLDSDSRILDVGCGPGLWVRYFLRNGYFNLSACDITAAGVNLTKKSLEIFGLKTNGEIIEGNAEELPFPSESFDHINCQGVIHHTPNTAKCIQEFYRVLKPGGTVCFSVYYKNWILRSPLLLKLIAFFGSRLISLKGRGRENMLAAGNPEELVRLYDGKDNPIGKAYTLPELEAMSGNLFVIQKVQRHFFPARALPFPIPRKLHEYLHARHGLMIVLYGRKKG